MTQAGVDCDRGGPLVLRAVVDRTGPKYVSAPDLATRHPKLLGYAQAALALGIDEISFLCFLAGKTHRASIELSAVGPVPPTRNAELRITHVAAPLGLTPRELEVLTLIAGGLTNTEIAARLGAHRRTVATHLEHILGKTGQSSRTGAATLATESEFLVLPPPGRMGDLPPVRVSEVAAECHATSTDKTPRRGRGSLRRRPIVLGSVYPLRGPAQEDGRDMLRGAELALAEISARGGIAGREVEHRVVPADAMDVTSVRRAFTELLQHEVDAITLGYVNFDHSVDLLAQAAESGRPLLHSMVRHLPSAPTTDQRGRVFQVCAPESVYWNGFVRAVTALREQGCWVPASRRLTMVVRTTSQYAEAVERVLCSADASGWELAVVNVPPVGADWREVGQRIHKSQPAAVLVSTFAEEDFTGFLRNFSTTNTGALMFGVYVPSISGFIERAGDLAEGLLWSTVIGTYADPLAANFVRRFHRFHHRRPGKASAGVQYDMVNFLALALAQVDKPWNFEGVSQALTRTIHRGVSGSYFVGTDDRRGLAYPDETSDASLAHAHLIHQIQRGEHRIIDPPAYAEAPFQLPPWLAAEPCSSVI